MTKILQLFLFSDKNINAYYLRHIRRPADVLACRPKELTV